MISVDFGGAIYEGRLVNIRSCTEQFCSPDGITTYKNYAYEIVLMDAFGAEIKLHVASLSAITFIGE